MNMRLTKNEFLLQNNISPSFPK